MRQSTRQRWSDRTDAQRVDWDGLQREDQLRQDCPLKHRHQVTLNSLFKAGGGNILISSPSISSLIAA